MDKCFRWSLIVCALVWSTRVGLYVDYRLRRMRLERHCGEVVDGTFAYCGGGIPMFQVYMDLTKPPLPFWRIAQ